MRIKWVLISAFVCMVVVPALGTFDVTTYFVPSLYPFVGITFTAAAKELIAVGLFGAKALVLGLGYALAYRRV